MEWEEKPNGALVARGFEEKNDCDKWLISPRQCLDGQLAVYVLWHYGEVVRPYFCAGEAKLYVSNLERG